MNRKQKRGKIKVDFDFTIKNNFDEEEFWTFISYAIEQFAVPKDAQRLQHHFQQKTEYTK